MEDCVALYSFDDIFLSISMLFLTNGAASVADIGDWTLGVAADEDDEVDMAWTSCWITDSNWSVGSGDARGDVGVIAGSWPIADRVLMAVPQPPDVVGRFGESALSESLGFMLA